MANLNRVLLMGNLTRDPELRYIPSGTAVATFSLAVNRVYTSPSGEKKKDTCFTRVVVWGRMAEICGEFLTKGSSVFVEGRLQSRSWDTPEGQKRSTIEVVASSVQFLDRTKGKGEGREPGISQEIPGAPMEEDVNQSPGSEEGQATKGNSRPDKAGDNPPF